MTTNRKSDEEMIKYINKVAAANVSLYNEAVKEMNSNKKEISEKTRMKIFENLKTYHDTISQTILHDLETNHKELTAEQMEFQVKIFMLKIITKIEDLAIRQYHYKRNFKGTTTGESVGEVFRFTNFNPDQEIINYLSNKNTKPNKYLLDIKDPQQIVKYIGAYGEKNVKKAIKNIYINDNKELYNSLKQAMLKKEKGSTNKYLDTVIQLFNSAFDKEEQNNINLRVKQEYIDYKNKRDREMISYLSNKNIEPNDYLLDIKDPKKIIKYINEYGEDNVKKAIENIYKHDKKNFYKFIKQEMLKKEKGHKNKYADTVIQLFNSVLSQQEQMTISRSVEKKYIVDQLEQISKYYSDKLSKLNKTDFSNKKKYNTIIDSINNILEDIKKDRFINNYIQHKLEGEIKKIQSMNRSILFFKQPNTLMTGLSNILSKLKIYSKKKEKEMKQTR